MIIAPLLCALGLPAGFLLIRRVPKCPPAEGLVTASVSVIIPARNEERNLPRLLQSIQMSSGHPAEVLVVDDASVDGTAAVALQHGAKVVHPADKPAGWTGKAWACYQGAQQAGGDLLLFLDADTYFLPGGFDRMISSWSRGRDPRLVLSVLPYHAMNAVYEQFSLVFNILMASGAGGFSGIAGPRLFGQSLLIARDTYFAAGGHSAVRGVVLENLRWANELRACGCTIRCLGGEGTLQMRMFPEGFHQMTESWAKAFVQGAGDSGPAILLLAIAWISALWSTTLLLIMPHDYGRPALLALYCFFAMQIRWQSGQLGSYRSLVCLLFPVPLAYYCVVFGRSAARRALGRRTLWKGREV